MYQRAVGILVLSGRASTSALAQSLTITYRDAMRLVDRAEREGVVSTPSETGRREVLARPQPTAGTAN